MASRVNPGFCRAPLCQRTFRGSRGLSAHLSHSVSCDNWYKSQIRNDLNSPSHVADEPEVENSPLPWSAKPALDFVHSRPSRRKSVTVEDEEESDLGVDAMSLEDDSKGYTQFHPSGGKTYGKGRTIMEQIDKDDSIPELKDNIYYPFASKQDFEMASWLSQSNTSASQIDAFLKLSYITERGGFSFRSARELNTMIAMLPQPPAWKSRVVTVDGGTTKEPLVLYYRDTLEVFKLLFGNPLFANLQDFVPSKVWEDCENGIRIFSGPFTGDLTYEIQNQVGDGETLGLVMLSSDKTLLTNISGDTNTHCVYMSCGNIKKEVRSKASARCWMKIAEIPVAKFEQNNFQRELSQRLYHVCMDIVTEPLKRCSHTPIYMTDANGDKRCVRTIMFAHLADLPEQLLIACCHAGASPLSLARANLFGSSEKQRPRSGIGTRETIRNISAIRPPNNIHLYDLRAAKFGLNSVHKPFWRNWKFADPQKFLAPDPLHQWHKFFGAHVLSWATALIGKEEMDRRFQCLQKHIGHRHFPNGFTSLTQHTCREYREIEASFLAAISGHPNITPGIMTAFRAILDFIYLGQLETHSTKTLGQLRDALTTFHSNKHHLSHLRNGPRQKGQFNIPKLELMQHVGDFVESLGSLMQYSTEHTEHCHITLAKAPFRATNKKDYEIQICLILDRREKIDLFITFLEWRRRKMENALRKSHRTQAVASSVSVSDSNIDSTRPIEQILSFARAFIPDAPRDAFQDDPSFTPRNDTTAFILTNRITRGNAFVSKISHIYNLPHLHNAIVEYYEQQLEGFLKIKFLDCWDRVRLQLRSTSGSPIGVTPAVPVMACPAKEGLPSGLYNFVLVKEIPGLEVICFQGHFAAQLRLVFQPLFANVENREPEYLAYVEPLQPAPGSTMVIENKVVHERSPFSRLYKASRLLNADGSRQGMIINLTDIWRPIDVVPVFGAACRPHWNTNNAIELAKSFYINPFYDKSTFTDLE